ncbi:SusD/RagB family nutrient-binding outer membrane lipoprotein, partial [Pedobacter sp.]|uniref:SusD/RagB family nutrient-binding outer membrane lipoprotein n=1 Tax=Pedobacter sp. TaxID=1411316 RepID=UPI003D7F3BE4
APDVVGNSDPVFGGKAANWRKFGNSLYLRLLLRVSGKAEVSAESIAKIKDMVNTNASSYPIITSNAESAILKWTGIAPYVSPYVSVRVQDWPAPKLAEFFVSNLTKWADPRIAKWATTSLGAYAGIPSGYPVGQTPVGRSYQPLTLQSEPLLGNIMNYAEVQFILAEAATKGFITGTPATYYHNGILNSISLWGYTPTATYLSDADLTWDDAATLEEKMEMIHVQKYYALFMTDLEGWFEYRRTGHPVLPNGGGLRNNGVMPARLNYPNYVVSANPDHYKAAVAAQGPDEISTQVWWQKP